MNILRDWHGSTYSWQAFKFEFVFTWLIIMGKLCYFLIGNGPFKAFNYGSSKKNLVMEGPQKMQPPDVFSLSMILKIENALDDL